MTSAEHTTLWLQGIALFLTFCGMCGTAGWIGAKLAMKAFYTELKGIHVQLGDIIDNQKQLRRVTLVEFQKELEDRVSKERCDEDRGGCFQIRTQSFCEMSKQVAKLTSSIEILNDKREQAKDELHNMFVELLKKMTEIEKSAIIKG